MTRKWRIAALTAFVIEIALWFADRMGNAITVAMRFNGFPADGPFQTFNPLRRIAAGQHGGVDFQFFHGLGVPYVLYPLFAAFGKTIFSAELSREVISVLGFVLAVVAIVYVTSRDAATTIIWTTVGLLFFQNVLLPLAVAANSLIGLRSTAPLLFAAVLLSTRRGMTRIIGSAVALGLALALGSEQGLAVIVAFVATQMLLAIKHRTVRPLADGAVSVMIGIGTYLLFLVIIGGPSGCRNALRYAFKDVPGDQFWYFGSPPNAFLSRWPDVFTEPYFVSALALTVTAAIVVFIFFWRASAPDDERVLHAVAVLMMYGLISGAAYLGIAFRGNLLPMLRALFLGLVALGACFGVRFLGNRTPPVRRALIPCFYVFLLVLAIADSWLSITDLQTIVAPRYRAYVAAGRRPRLSPRWQWDLAIAHRVVGAPAGAKPRIWSTYAGLLQSDYGIFNPSFDYIIHALGEENRRAYLDAFRRTRPEYVETVRRSLFQYEDWLREMHWDFYSELLHHYTLVAVSSHSLWWKLGRATPLVEYDAGSVDIGPEGRFVQLQLPRFQSRLAVVVITLRYRLKNRWAHVPVIGQLPRYLVIVHGGENSGPFALSPNRTVVQIPIFVRQGQTPSVGVATESLVPGASVTVLGAQMSVIEIDAQTELFLAKPFLTDRVPARVRQDF
ncbi:MAG: hypothetical protein QOD64_2176 [Verrucomicrobiota bacterium]